MGNGIVFVVGPFDTDLAPVSQRLEAAPEHHVFLEYIADAKIAAGNFAPERQVGKANVLVDDGFQALLEFLRPLAVIDTECSALFTVLKRQS